MRYRFSASDDAEGVGRWRGECSAIEEGKALCEEHLGRRLEWTHRTRLKASGGSWRNETICWSGYYPEDADAGAYEVARVTPIKGEV